MNLIKLITLTLTSVTIAVGIDKSKNDIDSTEQKILTSRLPCIGVDSKESCSIPEVLSTEQKPEAISHTSPGSSPKCSLYIAQSSIPNSGFGVFTTKHIKEGEPITQFPDAPSIVITDLEIHHPHDFVFLHDDYTWQGDGYSTFESHTVGENVMNLGSLSNYHAYLKNVEHANGDYDDTFLNRFQDPGAGAFSYYEGQHFVAAKPIYPGQELFVDYGTNWLDTREGSLFDNVPRYHDYSLAARIIREFTVTLKKMNINDNDSKTMTMMFHNIVRMLNRRVASLIPDTEEGLRSLLSIDSLKILAENLANRTIIHRNVSWIEEYGKCIDNIVPKRSTIKQAGRGAFASRDLKNGTIIVPVPLLQITDHNLLNIYNITTEDERIPQRINDIPVGSQLLINYCFGHEESTMLLCPTTNAALINHCSDRMPPEGDCKNGPNAKIQWSDWDTSTAKWRKMSINHINNQISKLRKGLTFDIVALRDISEGEEIFIDYGEKWEKAFSYHMKVWEAPVDTTANYTPVKVMNHNIKTTAFRTVKELKVNPYPDNIQTACFKWDDNYDKEDDDLSDASEIRYTNNDIIEIIDLYDSNQLITNGSNNIYEGMKTEVHTLGYWYPCHVLTDEGENKYSVRILINSSNSNTQWATQGKARILIGFPKTSIKFVTKTYKSDQHLPNAFRHYIGIPTEILPDEWKNNRLQDAAVNIKDDV